MHQISTTIFSNKALQTVYKLLKIKYGKCQNIQGGDNKRLMKVELPNTGIFISIVIYSNRKKDKSLYNI